MSGVLDISHKAAFTTTHWSNVLHAGRGDSPAGRAALEQLCAGYWYPLYAHVRRRGHGPDAAADLTQEFFATLLRRNSLAQVGPEKGRFRTFLLTSLDYFLHDQSDHAHAAKRGGGVALIELDALSAEQRFALEPATDETPDKGFDRRWAAALIEQAFIRLHAEQSQNGHAKLFTRLKPFLAREIEPGEYEALAVELGTLMAEPNLPHSLSTGDPSRHLPLTALESSLRALTALPKDSGRLALIVRRHLDGSRETPEQLRLTPEDGVPGDSWGQDPKRMLDAQIAVMQRDVADLIANGQPLTLFGDSLFVELDLSTANLPTGTRLRIGEAVVEVTPMPHDGCSKFKKRFGGDALFFVNAKPTRHLNLRGIYWKVIEAGEVRVGSPIAVMTRP